MNKVEAERHTDHTQHCKSKNQEAKMADPPQKSQGDLKRQVETKILGRKEMDEKITISILKAKI